VLWAALAVTCTASHAAAQGAAAAAAPNNPWETLTKRVELRQNTNIKKDVAKPAFFTLTNPDDGLASHQIGVGVLTSLIARSGFDIDALVDYQRNTLTDKEQDSLKLGGTGYWRTQDLIATGHSPLISFRSNYRNDGVKDTRGWQNAFGYTHLFAGATAFPLPNLPFHFGAGSGNRTAALELLYVPYAGVEFDTVQSAATEEAEGTATRGVLQVNLALYPAPQKTRNPFEILLGYAYRGDLQDGTNETDDSHPLFTFETNYFPVQNKSGEIGFGVTYTNGENPDEGLQQQAFWQVMLKFRIKKS
jgi:hypothetical protein